MNDVKISIIMPVYNAAKYLRETLDSVVNQTFSDFELIAVNDGSTDNSGDILEEYNNRIENYRIINQENSGVSISRNNGIHFALGKYVSFLDADDILDKHYLELLYSAAQQHDADIVFCQYYPFYDRNLCIDQTISDHQYFENVGDLYGDRAFEYAMKLGLGTSGCNKLYRKEILKNSQIYFDAKSTYGEDMFFNWKAFLVSNNIFYIPQKLYGYRQNESSATSKYHPHLYESYMREYDALRLFAEKNNVDMEQFDKSVELNLSKRINSFLRMDIRERGTLYHKYKNVKKTVNKENLQQAAKACLSAPGENSNRSLYRWFVSRQYVKVYCHAMYSEARLRLAKYIKNKH